LIEARHHIVAKVCFKLSIKILGVIFLVSEGVHANSILSVFVGDVHSYAVFTDFEVLGTKLDVVIIEYVVFFHLLVVDQELTNFNCSEIKE
jgi:hypothetical protein